MSRDLLDEIDYLENFKDFQDLVESIYRDANIVDVLNNHQLIVVGGQALAFWYARYFLKESRVDEFQAAYSDDLDFYGVKSSIEFCESRLGIHFNRPKDFDVTVNLAMTVCVIEKTGREVIIDILHEVGGLEREEILQGIELLPMRGIEVPVINPILCLRSRMHNYFAPYKADKLNELSRLLLCIRFVRAYLTETLEAEGWSKRTSKLCESIISLCLSHHGRELFCKQGTDLLLALPDPGLMHEAFVTQRLPRARQHIESERQRMHSHLLRFDKKYKPAVY
jgi:hypothetical protein